MGNVVAQLQSFNRGVWRVNEEFIRKTYQGKRIRKGCKYTGIQEGGIPVPDGCYWLVYSQNGTLLDNGYINQFTGEQTKELPNWSDERVSNRAIPWIYLGSFGMLFWIIVVCVYLRRRNRHENNTESEDNNL